ncbi:MAG: hypothetical protein ACRC5H_09305, partial [Treponemataceae bacterium]
MYEKFMLYKLLKFLFSIIFVAVVGYVLYFYGKKQYDVWIEQQFTTKIALISEEIQKVSELSTVKLNYSDLIAIKKSSFFGLAKSHAIIRYNAILR